MKKGGGFSGCRIKIYSEEYKGDGGGGREGEGEEDPVFEDWKEVEKLFLKHMSEDIQLKDVKIYLLEQKGAHLVRRLSLYRPPIPDRLRLVLLCM